MSEPELAIIIPTHKRPDTLKQCLEHIGKQTVIDKLEVVVVSDGHDPETAAIFEGSVPGVSCPITFLEIQKSQQGTARNTGLKKVTASTVLFIGDDIFLEPDAAEAHLMIQHMNHSEATAHHGETAVVGFTTWDPALEITPVMKWLEESGWQFGYPLIEGYAMSFIPRMQQHRFTYTSHISLPTKLAKRFPFREDVRLYGWEDIEWGERLAKDGVRLFYCDVAKAYHHHHITLEQSLKRMETLGQSIKKFHKSDRYPKWWKRLAYHVLILLNSKSMQSRHRKAFLEGLKSGKNS